jgi:hypothetical protein
VDNRRAAIKALIGFCGMTRGELAPDEISKRIEWQGLEELDRPRIA